MNSSKPFSSPDDHISLLIGTILVAVGVLFVGPVPFAVVGLVLAAGYLFGGRATAFAALALAPVSGWITYETGQTAAYLTAPVRLFWSDLGQPNSLSLIAQDWFGAIVDPTAWKVTSWIGLLGGGGFLFLREDHRNSPETQVTGRGRRHRPTPWARFRTWLVLAGLLDSRRRSKAITIGADIDTGRRVQISFDALTRTVLVVGRPGRGKTESVLRIAASCAANGLPIVYVNGKGDADVRDALLRLAAANGRQFYSLDAMQPQMSCAYDAFAHKTATTCTDMVIALRPKWTEDHYKSLAGAHALTVCKTLKYAGIQPDLHQMTRNLSVRSMLALARRINGKKGGYRALACEIQQRRANESAAIDSLQAEISLLTDSGFGECFDLRAAKTAGRPVLRLRDARESKAIAYIGLPTLPSPDAAARLASLVIGDLRATLSDANTPWLMIFDEFTALGANNGHILNLVNMGRSFRGCAILATQSLSDVSAVSESFLPQIVGSVNTFIIHELTDPGDAEFAAGIIGTVQAVDFTAQIVNHVMTGSASARSAHSFKVHPDEIKHFGVGEAIVFNKDHPEKIARAKIKRADYG